MLSGDEHALRVRIGDLEVDERRRELRGPSGLLAAQPKVYDLLIYLLRERDRVVSREELLRAIWPETRVGPDSITRALREVRRLLGKATLIRTYPARGVRFVGAVTELCDDRLAQATDNTHELFGVDGALASITALLEGASQARGGLRILIGPPGSGTSSLLAIAERRARAVGFAVVRASADRLLRVVTEAASAGVATLVIHEDLSGVGDAPPLDAHQLATTATNAHVAVIATCCSSARSHPSARAMLAAAIRIDPDAVVLLRPLALPALRGLAEQVLQRPVSQAGLVKLEAMTGGNPRLARHVLHLVKHAGRPLETLDNMLPQVVESLRELVLAHVSVLAGDARGFVDAIAVLDEPFTLNLAAEVAGSDTVQAADMIAEAVAAGVIVEAPAGGWRFAHELVRYVLERELAPSRRGGFHIRAAVALERWFGTPPGQLERIVKHYVSGSSAAHAVRTLELIRRATRQSLQVYSFEAAARWLTVALDVEAVIEPASPLRRRALWLELAKLLTRDGQFERAAEAFAAAESLDTDARVETDAVRAAFHAIATALPQIVVQFYELLFARHPQLRGMFGRTAAVQRRMFGEAIVALAEHADDPDWLHGHLTALGRRHAEYGVTAEMYGWARAAFLDAIASALDARQRSDGIRQTWARMFDTVAQLMLAASDTIVPIEPPPAHEPSAHPRS